MSGGSKKVTVGYEYYLGVHLALPYGPVDSIDGLIVGERDAEIQPVSFDPNNPSASGSIYVDKPNLFGGKKREGGVRGHIDVLWGHETQGRNSYLQTHQGANCPAYRGFTSLVFKSFLWSMMNPYFKAPWIKFKRLHQGWRGGSAWYPEKLAILANTSLDQIGEEVLSGLSWELPCTGGYTSTACHCANLKQETVVFSAPEGQTYNVTLRVRGVVELATYSGGVGGQTPSYFYIGGNSWVTSSYNAYSLIVSSPPQTYRFNNGVSNSLNLTVLDYEVTIPIDGGATLTLRAETVDGKEIRNDPPLSAPNDDALHPIVVAQPYDGQFLQIYPVLVLGETPTFDMNPAHIIYQCLTDVTWGMGYNFSDIDEASFTAVADKLYDENFGLSLMWEDQTEIEAFIKLILDHIDGSLSLDMTTGKFRLRLHRDDYVVGDLVELTTSNVLEEKSFQRAGYGEFANEVVVLYTDRMGNEVPLGVQNLASIQAQGAVISTTKSYPGIRESALASRVAMRDLRVLSTPLARVSLTTNRVLYNKEIGDVVAYTWPLRGITKLPMRIVKIDKGNILNGKIEVELVEDVFSLPSQSYTSTTGSEWVDTSGSAQPVQAARAIEAPYWDVFQNMSRADLDYLTPDYAFGTVVAARGTTSAPINFSLQSSPDNITYAEVDTGEFSPTGTLTANIGKTDTSIQLSSFYELDQVELDDENGYMVVDDECMAVVSCDSNTGLLEVRRGVLDTVPADHTAGARVYFPSTGVGYDPTERTTGETTYYKPCPTTGVGTLDTSLATALPITFTNRASRPYPPGQLKVNGSYYPEWIDGPSALGLTWAHRDRLQQTVSLIDYTSGSIGPEAGTTYTLRIYGDADTLVRTVSGLSGASYTYATADELTDGGAASEEPYWSQVKLLLKMNGTNNSTTFTDSSPSPRSVTANGQAVISTAASQFGGASGYFPGSADGLSTTLAAAPGSSDLTIEGWLKPIAASCKEFCRVFQIGLNNSSGGLWIVREASANPVKLFVQGHNGSSYINLVNPGTLTLPDAAFTHFELVRSGNNWKLYVGGVDTGTGTTTAYNITRTEVKVGMNNVSGEEYAGYFDCLRVTYAARHTANFTPQTYELGQYVYESRLNGKLRFELESVRDGLTSWQHHDHTVYRTGYGWNYGMHYG